MNYDHNAETAPITIDHLKCTKKSVSKFFLMGSMVDIYTLGEGEGGILAREVTMPFYCAQMPKFVHAGLTFCIIILRGVHV